MPARWPAHGPDEGHLPATVADLARDLPHRFRRSRLWSMSNTIDGRFGIASSLPGTNLASTTIEPDSDMAWQAPRRLSRHADLRLMAAIRHQANQPALKNATQGNQKPPTIIRWSLQEILRLSKRHSRRRIRAACVIAWLLRCRAHQAAA
jgi:hypothetical protein